MAHSGECKGIAVAGTKKYVAFIFGWKLFPMSDIITNKLGVPKEYLHVGIGIYNRLYHFTQNGIHMDFSMPAKFKVLKDQESALMFGTTGRTRAEFEDWLAEQNQSGAFSGTSYNVNNRNCICFARSACEFLGIDFGGPQIELQLWLETSNVANNLLETLRTNPLMQHFSRAASKLFAGDREPEVDVQKSIGKLFNVDAQMEKQYVLSNSGAQYLKEEDAAIIVT